MERHLERGKRQRANKILILWYPPAPPLIFSFSSSPFPPRNPRYDAASPLRKLNLFRGEQVGGVAKIATRQPRLVRQLSAFLDATNPLEFWGNRQGGVQHASVTSWFSGGCDIMHCWMSFPVWAPPRKLPEMPPEGQASPFPPPS